MADKMKYNYEYNENDYKTPPVLYFLSKESEVKMKLNRQDLVNYFKEHPKAFIELDNDAYRIYPDEDSVQSDEECNFIYSDDIDARYTEGVYKMELMKALAEVGNLNIEIELC